MKKFFLFGRNLEHTKNFYVYIENYLSSLVQPVSNEWDSWKMRLPKFYINFDKKVYYHTDWNRIHESLTPKEWEARASNHFGLLVPDTSQYWLVNGMNFWKLQF